jgi:REP element-mobilizing transposase RayT
MSAEKTAEKLPAGVLFSFSHSSNVHLLFDYTPSQSPLSIVKRSLRPVSMVYPEVKKIPPALPYAGFFVIMARSSKRA